MITLTKIHIFGVTFLEIFLISQILHLSRGFPPSSVCKESACKAGDLGLIPGWGKSSGEGNGNPLQYSHLENSIDRAAWQATVHGISRVRHDLMTKSSPPPPHLSNHENNKVQHTAIHSLGSCSSKVTGRYWTDDLSVLRRKAKCPALRHLRLLSLLTNTVTGLKGNQKGYAQFSTNLPQIWKNSLE